MPIDLEMLLSATAHPLFAYSPFADDRFSVASAYDNAYNNPLSRNSFAERSHNRQVGFERKQPIYDTYVDDFKSKNDTTSEDSYCTRKKKVSFADDKGLTLVEVREIPEAPKWAENVLNLLIGGAKRSVVKEKKWRMAFEHPPWENRTLLALLDKNKVVLESVSVKGDGEDTLSGTIKVANLAYKKNVFVRVTFDRWLSYIDVQAVYKSEENASQDGAHDTFFFNVKISSTAFKYDVIEFCVCFDCNGQIFWDNNGGVNYRLIADCSRYNALDVSSVLGKT